MKSLMEYLILAVMFVGAAFAAHGSVVYTQPHNGSGGLCQSSVNGTDCDQLTWDMFRVTNTVGVVGTSNQVLISPRTGNAFF